MGHFAQGFTPAIAVQEILIGASPLKSGFWLGMLTVTTCLAISAMYELLEWWVAIIGATLSIAILSRAHDRALARIGVA